MSSRNGEKARAEGGAEGFRRLRRCSEVAPTAHQRIKILTVGGGERPDGDGACGSGVLAGLEVPLLPQSFAVVERNKFRDSVSIPSDENFVLEFQS